MGAGNFLAGAGSGAASGAAGGPIGAAIGAGIGAGASLFGAKEQGNAATKSAQIQSDAAKYASDAQTKSSAAALAFQQQQAAQDLVTANATQKANYDQWAAKEGRLSNLSALTGGGTFKIPDYVPIPTGGAAPVASAAPNVSPIPGVGLNAGAQPATPSPYTTTMAQAMTPQPAQAGMSGTNPNGLVMMKAPTGQTKMVPASMVSHYTQQGATVIG